MTSDNTDLFPYEYIGDQKEIVDLIRETVERSGSAVIESGTGTGKTVVSLTGSIEAVLGTGKKIIYLTRTKSQQRQIIHEAEMISRKVPVMCIGLQGRNIHACPMMAGDPELEHGTSDELSKLCADYKKDAGSGPCRYYENIRRTEIQGHIDLILRTHPEPEQFSKYCLDNELCPYELTKLLVPHADVVAAPYPFVFMPHVLERFLDWLGRPLSETVMIIDEAHNLPDYLREVMTFEYSSRALELAEAEAREWGDPEIGSGFSAIDIISVFRECIDAAMSDYLADDDGLVPPTFIQDELMYRMGVSSHSLDMMYKGLMDTGQMVSDAKRSKKKLPRSYILSFGRFLRAWSICDEEINVCLIVGGDNPKFQVYCLDPWAAASPLRACGSSVHMSGTLAPLSDYVEELGLEDPEERIFPSPFPPENLKILYVDDLSTKFDELNGDPDMYRRIKENITEIIGCVRKNTAVFFPSYSLMDRFLADGLTEGIGREVFIERRGMTQPELMESVERFRMSEGGVLFAITGGRVSEGMDFPGRDLELAVIVGIPYPKPTAKQEALRRYCDYRFGDGWEHSSKIPAMRKMRQAIGRLIRSGTDRGVAVLLDRRVSSLQDIKAELTDDPCAEIRTFLSDGQK